MIFECQNYRWILSRYVIQIASDYFKYTTRYSKLLRILNRSRISDFEFGTIHIFSMIESSKIFITQS